MLTLFLFSPRVMVSAADGVTEVWEADAIVFAVGVSAMQRIVGQCPMLAGCSQVGEGS
jgi:hypothetical protein